jgi:uncharacterized protein (TIGR02300 family)
LTGPGGHVRKRANHHFSGGFSVAKSELGTKRVCPTTGRKFYDLNKDPIISPYTGMVVPVAPVVASRSSRAAEPKPVAPVAAEEVVAEEEEVEVISLDEADEEETTTGAKKEGADDIDIVDEEIPDADDDADTFLEEDEDDEVDAAELIDGELPGEEEA